MTTKKTILIISEAIIIAIIGLALIFLNEPEPLSKCGDGVCDVKEKANLKLCPIDCKENQDNGIEFCEDILDCASQMKCKNSVCVDVGCVPAGGMIPGAISPEHREHMATECCGGLKEIAYSKSYDENCVFKSLAGGPAGVCSNCGNGICEEWETKCNCPKDCETVATQTCFELDGTICSSSQTCPGSWLDASDSGMCCSVACEKTTTGGDTSTLNYEDSPFGFIQGEFVEGQGPSAEYLNDLGVSWNKISPGVAVGTPIFIETDDPNNINFQTDVNFNKMDEYLQTLVVDNGINVPLVLMVYIKINGKITKLDFDDYEELGTIMIERYDGDGVDDAPGSPLIKYWSLGGGEMNKGVPQGGPVEDRTWPLTEAQTAEYVKIGYDLIKELHPEFRARLDGQVGGIGTWQQGGEDDYYYNLVSELTGNNECSDLIFGYHYGSNPHQFKSQIEFMKMVDETLDEFGYNGNEIWTTDCGGSWEEWQGFTEEEHAGDVIRRYAYTIANGQEKLFWTRIEEYDWPGDSIFDYMGLVHNPVNDPVGEEKDWKKLSYYTYKLMVEKLEGSDWDNIQTIQESDNVYIYKFIKNNEPVWVAWWDYFDDTGSSKTITIDVGSICSVKITEAVPDAEDGSKIDENDYPDFFNAETKTASNGGITIILGESPVFVEEN